MSMTTELAQRMKAAALKATQGEWWSEVVETDGEYGDGDDRESGYHSYAVYDEQGRSLLDMTNSTAATIQTEWGHDYHMAWDVVGEHNANHIIASQPQNVLALVEALEAAQQELKNWRTSFDNERFRADKLAEAFKTEHEQLVMANRALITQHVRANGAERRIAELECYRTAYMEWSDKTDWVQGDKRFDAVKPWGMHRADVLKLYIEHLEARTVKMPVDREQETDVSGYDGTEFYRAGWNARGRADREALVAAGVAVESE